MKSTNRSVALTDAQAGDDSRVAVILAPAGDTVSVGAAVNATTSDPLSQFWLSRTGVIHVVAAGRCWQNAPSTSPFHENHNSIGIEAENDGSAPWPTVQLDAYKRLCAALCKAYGLPVARVKGHKEVNTAKPDPHSINMAAFRAEVARLISGEDDDVSAQDVWNEKLKPPYADPAKPEWQAKTVLTNHGVWLRKISEQVAAQDATIKALAEALASRDGAVDVDALMARIRAEIGSITVHLDTAPETPVSGS